MYYNVRMPQAEVDQSIIGIPLALFTVLQRKGIRNCIRASDKIKTTHQNGFLTRCIEQYSFSESTKMSSRNRADGCSWTRIKSRQR